MAKRKRENNKENTEKKINEGRGQGSFENYTPWFTIHDVASHGLSTRIQSTKTKRIHHFLSTLELDYFYLLEWSEKVVDIREQYPLDLKETFALANEIAIAHPLDPRSQNKFVMTTDFLVTIKQPIGTKDIARTIKYSKDLVSKRVLEKLEIERRYWAERNIDWGIVTELDLKKPLIKNIKWLYRFFAQDSLPQSITDNNISDVANYLLPIIKMKKNTLRQITNDCDNSLKLPVGSSLAIVRYFIAKKRWRVNLMTSIQPEKILDFITENQGGETL